MNEVAAEVANGLAVGLAEIGDGLKIRRQALEEPDDLKVAIGLALEGAAGSDGIDVPIEVKADEIAGVVGRAAAGFGFDTGEAKVLKIEMGDIDI